MSGFDFLAPFGMVALISLPVIFILHMRHSVPVRRIVPTLRFWQTAAPVQSDDPRFRIPPLSLTLLLQLVAAGAIALGLAQPVIAGTLGGLTHRTEPVHLVLVLDGSTSMSAADTDDGRTRFESARSDVLERLDSLRDGDTASVMVLGSQTTTMSASDSGEFKSLRERLAGIDQPGGIADLNAALDLVGDLAVPNQDEVIELFSDGAVSVDPTVVEKLPGSLSWTQYGRATSPNLAITDIVSRSALGQANSIDLYLQIANFSENPVETELLVVADGIEIDRQMLVVDPARPSDVTVGGISADTQRVVAEVRSDDSLFADNQASIAFADQGGTDLSVLLVSDLPGASERALAAIPGTVVTTIGSAEFADHVVTIGDFDLVAFDGTLPQAGDVPNKPVLFIDPPRGGVLPDNGMITIPTVESVRSDDSILTDVDLTGATFRETPSFQLDAQAVPLVESAEGPLIYRGFAPESRQRMVVLAFDLADSNLPGRIAFPILMANIVSYLAPGSVPLTVPLGQPLVYSPRSQTSTVTISDPLQHETSLSVVRTGEAASSQQSSEVVYTSTGLPGTYNIVETSPEGRETARARFTVNAGHPVESRLIANQGLQSVFSLASSNVDVSVQQRLNDLWPLLLAVAIGALLLEWFWTTVPHKFGIRRPARRRGEP